MIIQATVTSALVLGCQDRTRESRQAGVFLYIQAINSENLDSVLFALQEEDKKIYRLLVGEHISL